MPKDLQLVLGYQCVSCGKEFAPEPFRYRCDCGNNLDIQYDYKTLSKEWGPALLSTNHEPSLWRYAPLLPVKHPPKIAGIHVGGTPLIKVPESALDRVPHLYLKDDTRNPSASLKDRATAIGLQHALELGNKVIVAASTGNAAASLSALSAYYGLKAVILAPATAPVAKLTQILQYGATLIPVDGTYDDAFDLSLQTAERFGWYSRSTGINPVLAEGKKTAALEIAEQLKWQVPDLIFVPTGDGCILAGVYKGFYDLVQLGWIERIPRLVAVQAEHSDAVIRAWESDGTIKPVKAQTVADSISVSLPRDGVKAVRALKASRGFGIRVSDDEILTGQQKLAAGTGVFAEPAAAAAYAGYHKALTQNLIQRDQSAVLLITGSGLKDIAAAGEKIVLPKPVSPTIGAVQQLVKKAGLC